MNEIAIDRNQLKSVRRFPENNSNNGSNSNLNTNTICSSNSPGLRRPELLPKPTHNPMNNTSNDNDLNHNNTTDHHYSHHHHRVSNLLNASLIKSSNEKRMDRDANIHNNRDNSDLNSSNKEDVSFNHLINSISTSQPKSITRITKSGAGVVSKTSSTTSSSTLLGISGMSDPTGSTSTALSSGSGSTGARKPSIILNEVLEKGVYLEEFRAWHEFRGSSEIKKISKKVIEKNNNIWELVSQEYTYLATLVKLNEVYGKGYPYIDAGTSTHNQPAPTPRSQLNSTNRTDSSNRSLISSLTNESLDHHHHSSSPPNTSTSSSATSPGSQAGPANHQNNNIFESIESILPGLEPLIEYHCKIAGRLIDGQLMRPDRVITDIGRVLNESLTDDICKKMAELYGTLNFTKQYIDQKLNIFKKYPQFSSYLHKCERDSRIMKKGIPDWLLLMSMHWTKTITTVNSLINNTINDSQEVSHLQKCQEKIDGIIKESSKILETMQHKRQLKNIIDNFEVSPDNVESEMAYKYLTADNAILLHSGELQYETKKVSNSKILYKDVIGVALESCMFFLVTQTEPGKNPIRYQLFQDRDFPSLLEWGKLYGYFREGDSKSNESYSFYVIIERPRPLLKRLFVNRSTERAIWKTIIMKGFECWQSEVSIYKTAENELDENLKRIEQKWRKTVFGLELIKNLDHALQLQLDYRTVGFKCILEEEWKKLTAAMSANNITGTSESTGNSMNSVKRGISDSGSSSTVIIDCNELSKSTPKPSNATTTDTSGYGDSSASIESYIPDLSTREGLNDWLDVFIEWVNRLKFSVFTTGTNITRSASEIEARKRPSVAAVKKCETFSSPDSTDYSDKKTLEMNFLNQSVINKKRNMTMNNSQQKEQQPQHNQQRRVSVSSFTNFFRINSRNSKHDDFNSSSCNQGGKQSPSIGGSVRHRLPISSLADTQSIGSSKETLARDETGHDPNHFNSQDIDNNSFLSSPLSKDVVVAFNEINKAAKNITMELLNLSTQKTELEAELRKMNEENQVFREFYMKIKTTYRSGEQSNAYGSSNIQSHQSFGSTQAICGGSGMATTPGAFSGPGSATSGGGVGAAQFGSTSAMSSSVAANMGGSAYDVVAEPFEILAQEIVTKDTPGEQKAAEYKLQLEHLRQVYEKFGNEKAKWKKEYEKERIKLENDKENLFQKTLELEHQKELLEEREKKHIQNCLNLQNKVDLYYQNCGINIEDKNPANYSSLPNSQKQPINTQYHQNVTNTTASQMLPHSRSHSDDASHKRSSTTQVAGGSGTPKQIQSPPLASMETNVSNSHNNNIPDHLRSSLINQERQMKTTASESLLDNAKSRASLGCYISKVSGGAVSPKITKTTPGPDRRNRYGGDSYSRNNDSYYPDNEYSVAAEFEAGSDVEDRHTSDSNSSHARAALRLPQQSSNCTTPTNFTTNNNSSSTNNNNNNSTFSRNASVGLNEGLKIPLDLAQKTKVKKDKKLLTFMRR